MSRVRKSAAEGDTEEPDHVPPEAACLAESLRAFSYELPTALADLVDNSLTARARNIWLDFHWDGADSVVTITDDGAGMTEEKLRAAMRPGSQSPLLQREPHDLGRFGLGLKTASFSQARRFTVRSRVRGGQAATRCWDLDHIAQVNDWQLLRRGDAAAEPHFHRLAKLPHGTAVVWQKLDRLVAGNTTDHAKQQDLFLQRATVVRDHLAMVFHLLMGGRQGVQLWLNGRAIEPWDPFLADEKATQLRGVTRLKLRGETVEVEPFVLPHHSRLSRAQHERAGGPHGWNAHQGFYVYRHRRLLVAGDWLGFGWRKEEHYKLARIRVEVPNALDHDWSIDVTKSRALPPPALRDELRRIAENTRARAKEVYGHRGRVLAPRAEADRVLLWEPLAKHNKTFYRISREHPLVRLALASSNDRAALNALLRMLEETVPFPHITIENSENPNSLATPFEQAPDRQIQEVMAQAFRSLTATGYGPKEAVNRLGTIWPFQLFPALLQTLAESHHHA
jgi:hypothetical protein